jgi:outer membrane protein assembly factor BamB
VGGNGRLFVVTDRGDVVAVKKSGEKIWSRTFMGAATQGQPASPDRITAPPAWAPGLLVVVTEGGRVRGLDETTGLDRWTYEAGDNIQGSPNWFTSGSETGVVVLVQPSGAIHLVDAGSGRALRSLDGEARADGSPAVSGGQVVFGSCAAAVHALALASDAKSAFVSLGEGCEIAGGVAVDRGEVFTGNRSGALVCVDLVKGEVKWQNQDTPGEVFTTPAVKDANVVFVDGQGGVVCLDRSTGKKRWTFEGGAQGGESPVIVADCVLVSAGGQLVVLALSDGRVLARVAVGDSITSPAVIEGRVFVGTSDGRVVALEPR